MANIKNKDIDLLKAYHRKTEPSKYDKVLKASVLPLSIIALVLCLFGFVKFKEIEYTENIEQVNKEIKDYNDLIVKVGSEDYNNLLKLQSENLKMEEVQEAIKSYPRITSNVMNVFFSRMLPTMELTLLNFDDGKMVLNFESQNVLNAQNYVRSLRESGRFEDVKYDGYQSKIKTYDVNDTGTSIEIEKYEFKVECVLKGGAE